MTFKDSFFAENGFRELNKLLISENDFSSSAGKIFIEKADLATNYAKGLLKLSVKAKRINACEQSTISAVWSEIASEFEKESRLFNDYGINLAEEVNNQLKALLDENKKLRYKLEQSVAKSEKVLSDGKYKQRDARSKSYYKGKDLIDTIEAETISVQSGIEKDINRLKQKRIKAEDSAKKADSDYLAVCLETENKRHAWERELTLAFDALEEMETKRLNCLKNTFERLVRLTSTLFPGYQEIVTNIQQKIDGVNAECDITAMKNSIKSTGCLKPELILYDSFAEHPYHHMSELRRSAELKKKVNELKHKKNDYIKSLNGMNKLVEGFTTLSQNTDNILAEQQSACTLIEYLDACEFKCADVYFKEQNIPLPEKLLYDLKDNIQRAYDKSQQVISTMLYIPLETYYNTERHSSRSPEEYVTWENKFEVEFATPAPIQITQSFDDEDLFDEDVPQSLGKCRALYTFEDDREGMLRIETGDLINLLSKEDGGWWQGELNGVIGFFPESYVEELKQ